MCFNVRFETSHMILKTSNIFSLRFHFYNCSKTLVMPLAALAGMTCHQRCVRPSTMCG